MEKNYQMGFGPTVISLNFESDLDHRHDTKKSRFSHLLSFTLAEVPHSPSAFVFVRFMAVTFCEK